MCDFTANLSTERKDWRIDVADKARSWSVLKDFEGNDEDIKEEQKVGALWQP
jgi:hypothetical protein